MSNGQSLPHLSPDQISQLFPAYIIVDTNLKIVSHGAIYQNLFGSIIGKNFGELFNVLRPKIEDVTYDELIAHQGMLLILQEKSHQIRIRGQFLSSGNNGNLIYCGSVWMNTIEEFESSPLSISSFALHDPLIEMLQILKGQEIITEDIKSLLRRISEQKELIEARGKKYRDLLENLYDSVISFDEESNIIECNKALCTLTGYSETELLTMTGKDITHPEDWEIARESTKKLQRDGYITNFQLRCLTKSGEVKHIEISSSAIVENGVYKGSRDIVRDITERRKSEEQLRDLSMVSENTSNMVIIADAERNIEWVNKSFINTTGYTLEEIKGKSPGKYLQGSDSDLETIKQISECLNRGEGFNGTILNFAKNGTPYWNELTINPVKDRDGKILKYISVATDVTERIQKNEELLNSELRWKFALEGSGDGVFEFDAQKQKFYATDSLKSLLGFDSDLPDLDFEQLITLIHPNERVAALDSFYEFISKKNLTYRHEIRLRKNNGDYVWVLTRATVTKYDAHGMPLIILGTTTDISHSKETEKELLQAKTEAEKASEYKNQFLSTMSHEIRTPLNAIIGLTNVMMMKKPTGEMKDDLSTLLFSANHLLTLINDVLDLSKIESGKIDFMHTEFDLYNTVKGVYQTFLPKTTEKKIDLSMSVDGSIPKLLNGDSLRLIQILNNLVNNAVKFTDKGSVSINVRPITFSGKKVKLLFEVTDTGMGISQKHQKNIFNDFVQADSTIVQKYGGTGLGLSITKKLIELQGGNIKVKSKFNEGSRFYFELSFDVALVKSKMNLPKLDPSAKDEPLKGIRVLLVEDIAVNTRVAKSYLDHWGAITVCAENGQEAIDIFRKENFDILFVDLFMPVMNGFDAMKKIRKLKKGGKVPMIALTASAETATIEKAIQAGANSYISKPFNPQELIDTISSYTNKFTPTEVEDDELSPEPEKRNSFEVINIEILESASLGNKTFILEMLEMMKKEVPVILNECKYSLEHKNYLAFADAIHKLKNSLMILGISSVKKTLETLEANSRKGKQTDKFEASFVEILSSWEKALLEINELIKEMSK